jgi:hypothetical protein
MVCFESEGRLRGTRNKLLLHYVEEWYRGQDPIVAVGGREVFI